MSYKIYQSKGGQGPMAMQDLWTMVSFS